MKKSLLLIAIVVAVFGCMAMTSCNDKPNDNDFPPRDESLAGSVSYAYYPISVDGLYDNGLIDNYAGGGFLMISKTSDTEIKLSCLCKYQEKSFEIVIPTIPLTGEPYNVTFDHSSSDATVSIDESKYSNGNITCKGWIRSREFVGSNNICTRNIPDGPILLCDMDIDGTIDGKELHLKIRHHNY